MEIEADSTTQEAKEQGFVPEEEFSDVSHSFAITLYISCWVIIG